MVETCLLAGCGALVLAALMVSAYLSTLHVSILYNEGWNAYLDTAAGRGDAIYFPPSGLFSNNYPPLSFYIVGGAARIFGDAIFVGRAIAWLSFLAVGFLIFAILRRLGDDAAAATFGLLLFAGYMAAQYGEYIGYDDPQMLAHAIACLGLYVLIRFRQDANAVVASAALMAASLFVKHILIALPFATALWLFFNDRKTCRTFCLTGILCVAGGLLVCRAAFGPDFVTSLLAPRQYYASGYQSFLNLLGPMEVLLAVCVVSGAFGWRDRPALLFAGYALTSLGLALVLSSGEGVVVNRMFETVIAVSLAAGHFAGRLMSAPPLRGLRTGLMAACGIALLLGAAIGAHRDALLVRPLIAARLADERVTLTAVRRMAAIPGAALCQRLAVCYWAGKPMEADLFNFRQGVLGGTKQFGSLGARIVSGHYTSALFYAGRPFAVPPVIRETRALFDKDYAMTPLGYAAGDLYLRRDVKRRSASH